MNMKKTIAAVAACAMAVSAMATTVSAVSEGATEAQKVHYDLTIKEKVKAADFVAIANQAATTGSKAIEIVVDKSVASSLGDEVTIAVKNYDLEKSYEYKFTTKKDDAKYDGVASKPEKIAKVAGDGSTANPYKDVIDENREVYFIDLDTTTNGKALTDTLVGTKVDVTISFGTNNSVKQADLNEALKAGKIKVNFLSAFDLTKTIDKDTVYTPSDVTNTTAIVASTPVAVDFNIRGTVKENSHTYPMKTNSNVSSKDKGTADVFAQLAKVGSRDYDKSYANASAVINDMIANYDEVVFTFNTAKEKVTDYSGEYASWGAIDCTKFPQQLYNLFGDENSGYVYANSPTYTFNNLFNAALVANKDLTMNQNAIAPFVYNATSVSFEWDTMTATGGQFVSAANAIRTLQLATSSEWYWDSMDVVGYKAAVEDTESQAPVEADEEDLDDTDAEIDDTDDADAEIDDTDDADVDDADTDDVDDTDDADADDTTDEGDAAADEGDAAADETTGNPETGNAPIALAVIPVALAAAAVVAKKRG